MIAVSCLIARKDTWKVVSVIVCLMKANSWFGYSDVDHATHRYIKVVGSLATFQYNRGRVITAYSCMSYRASRPNAAMLLNVGLVDALLKELKIRSWPLHPARK